MIQVWPEFESPLLKRITQAFSERRKAINYSGGELNCEGEALIPEEWVRVYLWSPPRPSIELVVHNQGNAYVHIRRTTTKRYEQLIVGVEDLRLRLGANEFQQPLSHSIVEVFEQTNSKLWEIEDYEEEERGQAAIREIEKMWRDLSS